VDIGKPRHRDGLSPVAHTSRYRTPKWVEYFLTFCGTLSLEGGPIFWVATNRIHHQFTDQGGDPHSPRDGTSWAHRAGSLLVNPCITTPPRSYLILPKTGFHVWMYHYLPLTALGVALLAVGGLPLLLWGVFLRTVVGLHATWLVNSAGHI
jgi:fatty-acid desaturase